MNASSQNPILHVPSRSQDLRQREIFGFSPPREIVEVTSEFRGSIASQVRQTISELDETFKSYPNIPAIISLRLHPDAIAKTHRPMELLERVGMRPIGTRKFGELLLPATADRLTNLASIALQNEAKLIRANLSTLDKISAWNELDALGWNEISSDEIEAEQDITQHWIESGKTLTLTRFNSKTRDIDEALEEEINRKIESLEIETIRGLSSSGHEISKIIRPTSMNQIMELASCPAVRNLRRTGEVSPIEIRTQMFTDAGPADSAIPPPPDDDFPVVAVVDSGIPESHPSLSPWTVGHETFVLPPDTDHVHGTFVAGLISGGKIINNGDAGFPDAQSKVFDVAVLPNGPASADELLHNLETAVKAHPEIKVWNCSFGSSDPGHPEFFSDFAQELDRMADEHDVLFVIAAGNYNKVPLRAWPPGQQDLQEQDRISVPAESLRSLTVGSIAHRPALVQPDEPSPFSRKGPGAAKTPKPDVTHRGGNCTESGDHEGTGVFSLLPNGNISESIGTSFSTPLVSSLCANTWHSLEKQGGAPNSETVKALMIHSAALSSPVRRADERNYYGFGVPESVLDILFCSPDTFTLMFTAQLYDNIIWEKTPFPIPECLHRDGEKFQGEIFMTLVYSPPLDGQHGAEYVRANIDASFGTYDPDDEGEVHHHGLVPLEAPSREDLYERAMIDHGYKWSPVKVYHKLFPRGKAGRNFRLKLELLRRAGEPPTGESLQATVLISFRGITPDQPVYADGIRALERANWTSDAIVSRDRIRV